MNFLTRYKIVEAKIHHDIRDYMHHFWYSACKNVNDPYILFEFFEKLKIAHVLPPMLILASPRMRPWSLIPFHKQKFLQIILAKMSLMSPHPLEYGGTVSAQLNHPFESTELKEAYGRTFLRKEHKINAYFFKSSKEHCLMHLFWIYNKIL